MSKKKSVPQSAEPVDEVTVEEIDELDELSPTSLVKDDRLLLDRSMRFLVSIQTRRFVARARREGYSAAEHTEGWRLWKAASGSDRPLDHWLYEEKEQSVIGEPPALGATLQALDDFENMWFPRTRMIIARVVPASEREAFLNGFFANLSQQPLGPSVVGSVRTFLSRVDGLASSSSEHAKAVRKVLASRGLTDARLARVRALLDEAEGQGAEVPTRPDSAAEVGAAQVAQQEALAALRAWFVDWATTLRTAFNVNDRIQLGLTRVRRKKALPQEE
ncbi:MAG: hypothetical protein HY791_22430 [Deltaproteobacteria bacterium]|nr:hypothetical protein [Deltaproteobacteria bacterium]